MQVSGLSLVSSSPNGSSSTSVPSNSTSTVSPLRPQPQSARTPATAAVHQDQLAAERGESIDDEFDDAEVHQIEWQGTGTSRSDIHQEIVHWIKAEQNVDLSAQQVKSKIAYMKRKYREALAMNPTGFGRDIRHRQEAWCPPFERLHAVFNSSLSSSPPECRSSEAPPVRSAILDLSDVEELDHSDFTGIFSESMTNLQGSPLGFSESIDRLKKLSSEQSQAYSDMMIRREAEFNNMLQRQDKEARTNLDEELERKRRRVVAEITEDRERARTEISEDRQRMRTDILGDRQRMRTDILEDRQRMRTEIFEDRLHARAEIAEERRLLKMEREKIMAEMLALIRERAAFKVRHNT
ncbi:hypothetical protein BGZ70_003353 [Mortierella alpina]|uniref:Uncharacterized protein n=1 Tax=Mortierella alpina TaxID=64518 RepID=A0A9P6JER0_MORAP|nr:hypothetical protein BGZ70_003353 [Mortierella alpina]